MDLGERFLITRITSDEADNGPAVGMGRLVSDIQDQGVGGAGPDGNPEVLGQRPLRGHREIKRTLGRAGVRVVSVEAFIRARHLPPVGDGRAAFNPGGLEAGIANPQFPRGGESPGFVTGNACEAVAGVIEDRRAVDEDGVVFFREEARFEVLDEDAFHSIREVPPEAVGRFLKLLQRAGPVNHRRHRSMDYLSHAIRIQSVNSDASREDVEVGLAGARGQIDPEGGAEIDDFLIWRDDGEAVTIGGEDFKERASAVEVDGAFVDERQGGGGFEDGADVVREIDFGDAVIEHDPGAHGEFPVWWAFAISRVAEGEG